MKRSLLRGSVGAILIGVAGAGAFLWQRQHHEIEVWNAARPAMPALNSASHQLRQRIQNANARASQWPADLPAMGELARLYLANGFQHEAEQSLRSLINYDPKNAHWDHYLATLQAGYGQLDEAISLWQRVVVLAPDYRTAQLKLGEALLKANRLDEAAKVYGDIRARDPNEIYAALGLAQVDLQQGRWAAARENLEAAVSADPLFSAAWALLATVADRLGDAGASEQARQKANVLGRFKDVADPWTDELIEFCYDPYRLQVMASTITATGGGKNAIPILERAISVAPNDSRPHRQLGKVQMALHENDRAHEEFEKAIALQPGDSLAYLDLVGLYRANGDVAGALSLLERAVKNCPTAEGVQLEMALALMASARNEEALPYLQKALELAPDNAVAYQELAKAQFRLARKNEAVETLRVGLQRNPETAGLLAMMARYEVDSGDAKQAESYFLRAQKADANQTMLPEVAESFARKFGRAINQ